MRGIEVQSVSKHFGQTKALTNVSLHFEPEKIYGLLGRNGAGKTTLLNIISNRLRSDSGDVLLDGESVIENDKVLGQMFYVGEKSLYPESIKVEKVFQVTADFYPNFDIQYAHHLAELFELPLKQKISKLSTGYQSIFRNIVALSVNVPYVLLDEPVLGLDANHRELFYKVLIEKYSENPFTAIISTHLIEEAANLIEDVAIIKNGEVLEQKSKEDLTSQGYTVSGPAQAVDAYISRRNVIGVDTLGGLKTAYIMEEDKGEIPANLEVSKMDLQKLFIQLTSV